MFDVAMSILLLSGIVLPLVGEEIAERIDVVKVMNYFILEL